MFRLCTKNHDINGQPKTIEVEDKWLPVVERYIELNDQLTAFNNINPSSGQYKKWKKLSHQKYLAFLDMRCAGIFKNKWDSRTTNWFIN